MSALARTTEINCDTRAANEDCINGGSRTRTKYQYDAGDRLTQIAQAGGALISLAYDAANRRSSVTLPNGIVATPQFDAANELTSLSYDLAGTHIGDLAYSYDQGGRRITQSGSLAALGLPANITNASYDAANRLTSWGGIQLSYDPNGNLLSADNSFYTWNERNQLVATSDGGASFAYDAFGRRTSRTISANTDTYTYDGLNVASMSGSQVLNGDGIDEEYSSASAGSTSSFLTDAVGSTVAITDGAGVISGRYTYGPYGNTSHTGPANTTNQYTGRENDGDSNLYYYRARYYSPILGRFIAQDPIGLNGGINTYAYVDGNPISESDPFGLYPAIQVTLPDGTSYIPMTAVKNSAQVAAYGLPLGTSTAIAVPPGNDPQGDVDCWARAQNKGLSAFRKYWADPSHNYKVGNGPNSAMYDAYGNFEYGATGEAAAFTIAVLQAAAAYLHPGWVNNPINIADIRSGYDAIIQRGTLSIIDYNPAETRH